MRWIVQRSRYVLDERWIKVRADDCLTPAGIPVAPFYVFEYPDFVHVVALDRDERVILVRQYRHGLKDVCLELPGGMMEPGETDPVLTAERELREETGFGGGRFAHRATLSGNPATFDNRLHLVVAHDVEAGPASPEADEEIAVEVLPRDEAVRLAMSGGIMNAQHVGLLLMALLAPPRG
jgi:8-oxo-dGTP pyrophosphatase MutT (NUDIX family)